MNDTTYCHSCGEDVPDAKHCTECGSKLARLPTQFKLRATGKYNTSELIHEAGFPDTDEFTEALRYYPGEVKIYYEMDQNFNITPKKIKYDGETFLPKDWW